MPDNYTFDREKPGRYRVLLNGVATSWMICRLTPAHWRVVEGNVTRFDTTTLRRSKELVLQRLGSRQ